MSARSSAASSRPIGVFDSGVGGLTVLRALREALPHESFIYLGDTARLPYGTKSPESVIRYSIQAAGALVERDIKCLVIACNTASAVALNALRDRYGPLPVVGVLEPGALAACRASASGHIAVIATEGTVRGGAYQAAIHAMRPDARVVAQACALFVALAEEGWTGGPLVEGIVRRYLEPIFSPEIAAHPDCLLLGCTHFPVLKPTMRLVLDPSIDIVDSAETTARTVCTLIEDQRLVSGSTAPGAIQLLATDSAGRFARVGGIFFGARIEESAVETVDL